MRSNSTPNGGTGSSVHVRILPVARKTSTRRRVRLRWSRAHIREAAEPASALLQDVAHLVLERTSEAVSRAPRRPRGRGSALPPALQCAIMYHAAVFGQGSRAIAYAYGVNRGTVQRVLGTSTYDTFRSFVMQQALESLYADTHW
jgi:hypothetical protein